MTSTQAGAPSAAAGRPWGAMLVGFGAALVGMNLAVVRPMATQISSLEQRIEKLASGVEEMVGQTENARQQGSLLGKLVDNSRKLKLANDALARIESQQRQLELDGNNVDVGLRALDRMAELGDKVLRAANQAQAAGELMAPIGKLHEQLVDGQKLTRDAQSAWNEVAILRGQVLAQESKTAAAFAGMKQVDANIEAAAGDAQKQLSAVEKVLAKLHKLAENGISAEKVTEQFSRLMNMMFAVGDKVAPAEAALAKSLAAHDEAVRVAIRASEAGESLSRLDEAVPAVLERAEAAEAALAKSFAIHDEAVRVSIRASEAGESLSRLDESIPAVLDRAEAAERTLERAMALHARQAESVSAVIAGEKGLDALVSLADAVSAAGPRPDAHASLDSLADLQEKLLDRAPLAELSRTHLDQLLGMEAVLRDHTNLPEAIESIELLTQMEERFVEAAPVFSHVRDWMSEVVLLEGPVQRAVDALRPIQEMADVRRMSPQELRQAARTLLGERGAQKLARQPKIESALPEIAPLHAAPLPAAPIEATPPAEAVRDLNLPSAPAIEAVKEAPAAEVSAPAVKEEAAKEEAAPAMKVEAAPAAAVEAASEAKVEAPAAVEVKVEAAPAAEAVKVEAPAAVEANVDAPAAEAAKEEAPAAPAKDEPSVNESAAAESAALIVGETDFAGEARLDD